jgi:hypothetical protein
MLGCGNDDAATPFTGGSGGQNGGDGGSSPGGQTACGVTQTENGEPRFEQPSSRIRVYAGSYYTIVDGSVLGGSRREIHTEAERSGQCRLLTYDSPSFCDPICENPEICVHGQCERFPEPISAGTLSVELGDNRATVEPSNLGSYYFGTEEYGYDVVDFTTVKAAGDVAPAFELAACVSPAPIPTNDWDQLLQARKPAEDVHLAWSNPVSTARVYLRMTTCVGTHGGISPVEIECEGPDVGELTLPGSYLDSLYAQGWGHGECGSNEVRRYHASQTGSGEEAIQLRAESSASFFFQPRPL